MQENEMDNRKQYELKVNYAIGVTTRYAIKKGSMKAVFIDLLEFWKTTAKKKDFEAFVTDSTGRMFFFTFERGGNYNPYNPYGNNYDFNLSHEFSSDETPNGDDVYTYYGVDFADRSHRKLDFAYANYEVEKF